MVGPFTSAARVSIGELTTWQAAAPAHTVLVRYPDGSHGAYRRRDGEDTAAFASRIGTPTTDDLPGVAPEQARLAWLLRGDLPCPDGSEVFAVYPAGVDATGSVCCPRPTWFPRSHRHERPAP
ncbi:hypothetical protein AQ490_24435 [Wenjunlia vitaminophila]|uniref:Uncharacterized protein n=1 Tax=Wenjunlia vitaminophila TaxID=76728 RepID=A0A0T6LR10_WENVI|nr:hypothetical protein [Wenjunlia vitaminophila]KRV48558.1 hypothetical protein AQ490_24435 [Wenjunlia vitaminophila]